MYQKITQTEATANKSSAMESRNHSKNAVSLKNLMSRGNFLMFGIMLFVFCVFTNIAAGQTWNIGHNPAQGGNYLSNVTATLNGNTLTINGSGNMADFWCTSANQYDAGGEAPWWFDTVHRNAIHTVAFQSGSNVQNIGMRAFKDCSNLGTVTIPSSVNNINGQAFFGCSSLHTVIIEDGSRELEFRGYRWQNPCGSGTINTYDWFEGCTSITTLYLGRDISSPSPFNGISSLQSLTIGTMVTFIGAAAFANCSNLKTLILADHPSDLTFAAPSALADRPFHNTQIKTLHVGRDIKFSSIRNNTFQNNPHLTDLTIGPDVSEIPSSTFKDCSNLSSVIFPSNLLKIIRSNLFSGCRSLKSIAIPYIATIEDDAFNGCDFEELTIPSNVKSIGARAFANCSNLKTLILADHPSDLTFTAPSALADRPFHNTQIKTLHVGRDIKFSSIRNNTFQNNPLLTDLIIGCNVTSIPNNTFSGCSNIAKITSYPCPRPIIYNNTFHGVNKSIVPVHVYCHCLDTYQNDSFWNEFKNYNECITNINEPTAQKIKIYPNPTKSELFIKSESQIKKVEVYSLTGALLLSENNFNEKISVSALARGVYMVKIFTGSEVVIKKVVVE